jgi:hypothetical protein
MNGLVEGRIYRTAALAAAVAAAALAAGPAAYADETDAKNLLMAMSEYLGAQDRIAFSFVSDLEVVTNDLQKIAFVSSGTVRLERPDKIHATRTGGFTAMEVFYDGSSLTVLDSLENVYAEVAVAGTLDELIDTLRAEHQVHAPGADLLFSNVYDQLMPAVTDVKDLGRGIINGVECDHLAFRTDQVDWQIWIAAGDEPYPCRYVITSKLVVQAPEYRVDVSDWQAGVAFDQHEFVFTNQSGAQQVAPEELTRIDELPNLAATGGRQ